MIQPKSYLPVHGEIFYAPLLKENLRLEFASAEDKLDDLSLLAAIMLRDGKSADDIAQVTLLPLAVVENVLDELDDLSPEAANKILQLGDCVNAFNVSPPQIFSDRRFVVNVERRRIAPDDFFELVLGQRENFLWHKGTLLIKSLKILSFELEGTT